MKEWKGCLQWQGMEAGGQGEWEKNQTKPKQQPGLIELD